MYGIRSYVYVYVYVLMCTWLYVKIGPGYNPRTQQCLCTKNWSMQSDLFLFHCLLERAIQSSGYRVGLSPKSWGQGEGSQMPPWQKFVSRCLPHLRSIYCQLSYNEHNDRTLSVHGKIRPRERESTGHRPYICRG